MTRFSGKLKKILIANRGEIAVRILRSCQERGIKTVAILSDADTESLHVKLADEAVNIGRGPASESYLLIDKIIEAAKKTGADAIHPGYGLLSENPKFAEAIAKEGLKLIGPSAKAMAWMGNKTEARKRMIRAGVPVVPGSEGPLESLQEARKAAKEVGYPLLLKAVSGGGGRGMRLVSEQKQLKDAYESASREAKSAFGDDRVYMERYLLKPRHVEIQVLADQHGNCVHLGERECSIQRRHQKIIEEAPCSVLSEDLRHEMGECAVKAAKSVDYASAGTVEFLLDQEGKFYFIEMNTRIQVEHPITEMIYGIDLVDEQLRIAQGEKLGLEQKSLKLTGHAIECRICAEDPEKNYQPCPGLITGLRLPGGPGIRIDTFVYSGYNIPIYYDPMICKLIAWGKDRGTALHRMERALREFQIQGVKTNINQLQKILADDQFRSGDYHIHFLEQEFSKKNSGPSVANKNGGLVSLQDIAAIAAALSEFQKRQGGVDRQASTKEKRRTFSAWKLPTQSWRLTGLRKLMDRGL